MNKGYLTQSLTVFVNSDQSHNLAIIPFENQLPQDLPNLWYIWSSGGQARSTASAFGDVSTLRSQRHFRVAFTQNFQRRRDKPAARRLLYWLMKQQFLVKRYVTKKLCSCGATKGDVDLCIKRRSQKGPKNQLKNSQLPVRRREKAMQWFSFTDSSRGLYQSTVTFKIVSPHRPHRVALTT